MKQNAIRSKIKTALVIPALAIAILGEATLVKAIYYDPPTWQPMTMLNVSFNSSTKTLSVVDEGNQTRSRCLSDFDGGSWRLQSGNQNIQPVRGLL